MVSTSRWRIPDMACEGCVAAMTQAIQQVDPVAQIQADLIQKQVWIQSALSTSLLQETLKGAGFSPEVL
ncbi:MAG: heavy-metal-associated domain-containing protein [Gloeomargaritaceae cyanobacterium C42_A2020_066]|nr:heavy-metal-associated domain-containing protein [Gloeomargaritaceae cyanobacterium C42_A2020_066]